MLHGKEDSLGVRLVPNVRSHWASQSHLPALLASPDVEMTAVCTTRPETAEAAAQSVRAKLAFTISGRW